jgi:hypothetical protein
MTDSMTQASAIAAFLAARLDEDEVKLEAEIAHLLASLAADGCPVTREELLTPSPPDYVTTLPRRLSEVATDRELIARYEKFRHWPQPSRYQAGVADTYAEVIQLRVQRFSDHPGFLEGWAIF